MQRHADFLIYNMTVNVHSLHIYPIKSCQGIDLERAQLTDTGFQYDRHWMLVDKQGQFLTQRQHAEMALIKTAIYEKSLIASKGQAEIEIPLSEYDGHKRQVQIWDDQCIASTVSDQVSTWFSEQLNIDCDLVYLPNEVKRQVDRDYAPEGKIVGFADGFPLLLLSRSSIDRLNSKLDEPVSINRFRANIIVDGCDAHAEDFWRAITINGIEIQMAKPCSRCVIPSIDQQSAQKHPDILKTLAKYRRFDGKVLMGQNGLHLKNGIISINDSVDILSK